MLDNILLAKTNDFISVNEIVGDILLAPYRNETLRNDSLTMKA